MGPDSSKTQSHLTSLNLQVNLVVICLFKESNACKNQNIISSGSEYET